MSPNQNSNQNPLLRPLLPRANYWYWIFITLILIMVFLVSSFLVTPPAALFVVGIILLVFARRNEMRRRVNCWTLSIALERQIPLGRTIASLAVESGMTMRLRLWRLFCYIESGARFEDAICGVPKVIPRFALPLLRIGCLSGKPSRAMQIICSQDDTENHKMSQTLLGRLLYLTICLVLMGLVLPFLAVKIMPAFQKIGEDFDISGDALFLFSWTENFLYESVLGLAGLVFMGIVLILIVLCFYVLLRLMGAITFDLPFTGRFMRKIHRSRIQESLSLAAECDMPIGDAIRELALFYPTRSVQHRLGRVCNRVDSGRDWKKEMLEVDLLSKAEYAVAEIAEANGDLAWAFRLLADRGRRRMLYWAQWLQQILFAGLIIAFASIVFMLGFAMFEFLTRLIHFLAY